MTLAGGFIGTTDPVHHGGILGEAALQNFAPADQALAVRVYNLFDAANKVALQLFLVFQAFALHQRLAGGIVFPRALGYFVATNVNVRGGEQAGNFGEHVLQKLKGLVFGRRIDAGVYAALQRHLERPGAAAEFGIGGKRRQGMAGHFNLGDNRNVQRLRIGDHFADVVLRVESTVTPVRTVGGRRCRIQTKTHAAAPGTLAGQLGIFFNFNAPAVVIHQVPVEGIQLVHRHGVQQLFDLGLVEKVAADIQHESAPWEARLVGDIHAGQLPVHAVDTLRGIDFRRQQLQQSLHAVKEARLRWGGDDDDIGFRGQLIAFRAETGIGI